MDFDLTDEQRLLKESVDGRRQRYAFEQRKTYRPSRMAGARRIWASYAELGLLGLPFAEDDGGFGGSAVETMIVMEAFGRGLVVEPYLATVVLGGGFAASRRQRRAAARASSPVSPTARCGWRSRSRAARRATTSPTWRRRREQNGDGYVLDGAKGVVLHGENADTLVVSARTAGGRRDPTGSACSWSIRRPPRASRRGYPTQDGLRAADISLRPVSGRRRCRARRRATTALPLIERVVDEALAAMCAEAVGAMEAMLETTVEYLKTRKQFGVPIGSFQALQHRAADMLVALEQARSMAMFAAMTSDVDNASGAPTARRRRQGADRQVRQASSASSRCSCTAASA